MKKNSPKVYVILVILLALVSVIAFSVPTIKNATFWIAYMFTAVAFVVQSMLLKKNIQKNESPKNKFPKSPVVYISIVYAIIQTVAFVVFLLVPTLPVWSVIVVCSAIASVSAICIISADTECNEIELGEAKIQKKVFYIQELQADVESIANAEKDADIKAALTHLAEKISFSDPMDNEQLVDLESKISAKVLELKTTANKASIITELTTLLDKRNQKIKTLK